MMMMMMLNTKQKRQRFIIYILIEYFFECFIKTDKDGKPENPKFESNEGEVRPAEEKKERKVSIPILDLQMGNLENNTEEEVTEEGTNNFNFSFLFY